MHKSLLAALLAVSLVFTQCKSTKKTPSKPAAAGESQTAQPKKDPGISAKVKSCKMYEGLFPVYQDTATGELYLEVSEAQLGKDFIYFTYSENGVVAAGHNRGSYRDSRIFQLRKYFNRIDFVAQNTAFYFDSTNAISKSAEANISEAVLASEKIAASEGKRYLIAADNLFLTEKLHQVKPTPPTLPPGMNIFTLGNLSKERSRISAIRNYPQNTDLIVEYVYENPSPRAGGGSEVTDARYVSVMLQHSFIQVPENDYQPRYDDPRAGYFTTVVNDMTSKDATPYKDMIHRWHLKKKEPNAALSEPVEPITFWLEKTTPVEFRETIMAAGMQWNKAFEKAGFRNAIRMEMQPDTATWEAGDIRYNVLRWTSSPNPPFGGYGPSFVNPRTGQILGADIMLELVFVKNRLFQEDVFDVAGFGLPTENHENEMYGCQFSHYHQLQTMTGLTALNLLGTEEAEKSRYIQESLYYLVLHEMGHTLGLMHNMRSSQLHNPEVLKNKSLTEQSGLIGSVMDYPAVNLCPEKCEVSFFTTQPGPYDHWVIEFGYREASPGQNEKQMLADILAQSIRPEHAFGNDADDMRAPGKAIDPRVMVNDLSSDAIAYGVARIELMNKLTADLKTRYTKPDRSFHELRNAYLLLTGEMATQAGVISRYIGGVYVNRDLPGTNPNARPYTPVPLADQKRAMNALSKYVFSPQAFSGPQELNAYLQTQRRGFNFFSSAEDPKIHDRVLNAQRSVMMHLLHPNTLKRIHDSRLYGNEYPLHTMMADLTNAVFVADNGGNVNSFRQNLQVEYVKMMLEIATPGDKNNRIYAAQASALAEISKIEKGLKSGGGDEPTRNHRAYLINMIEKWRKSTAG